ncbi:restriction endonuclease [Pedobacter sp. UBA5917]|jgi:hypothetical protein|uniref:restriction endonuclease n=1 Tax=Pedobacter sp. UBA5917 TaxID=1947061 RepID=UPI0025CD21C4|nr:restriction endonuclease [Pedobacter sp. UBA5917]
MAKTKKEVRQRYDEIMAAKTIKPQRRGFELEKLIYEVLEIENLDPKSSYKPKGEQVDGSFFWMGQTFLFEAKWEKDPVPASTIFGFRGKVEGKFHTSSGIFIAMNGFSKDAEETLLKGKTSNILLFDGIDMGFILSEKVTFLDVLRYKLREAGDTGTLYAKYSNVIDLKYVKTDKIIKADYIDSIHNLLNNKNDAFYEIIVFVEGPHDVDLANNIIKFSLNGFSLTYRIVVLEGGNNITQIPSIINTYQDRFPLKGIVIFLDDDLETHKVRSQITTISEQLSKAAVSVNNLFLFLSEEDKLIYSKRRRRTGKTSGERIDAQLNAFFNQITEEYYDPEELMLDDTLSAIIKEFNWDKKEKCIYYDDDLYGMPSKLKNIDDLVDYLNDQMVNGRLAELPSEWIKEMDSLDYTWEIREYLSNNYSGKIRSIGWNADEL